jgi:hypothetical protein
MHSPPQAMKPPVQAQSPALHSCSP